MKAEKRELYDIWRNGPHPNLIRHYENEDYEPFDLTAIDLTANESEDDETANENATTENEDMEGYADEKRFLNMEGVESEVASDDEEKTEVEMTMVMVDDDGGEVEMTIEKMIRSLYDEEEKTEGAADDDDEEKTEGAADDEEKTEGADKGKEEETEEERAEREELLELLYLQPPKICKRCGRLAEDEGWSMMHAQTKGPCPVVNNPPSIRTNMRRIILSD